MSFAPVRRKKVELVKSVTIYTGIKKNRFTDEGNIWLVRQAEARMPIKELCRIGGFSDATFYKCRAKYGGIQRLGTSVL